MNVTHNSIFEVIRFVPVRRVKAYIPVSKMDFGRPFSPLGKVDLETSKCISCPGNLEGERHLHQSWNGF